MQLYVYFLIPKLMQFEFWILSEILALPSVAMLDQTVVSVPIL